MTGQRLTRDIIRAAAWDAGNRSARAAGRSAWNDDDYNAGVAEQDRLAAQVPLATLESWGWA